MIQIYLKRTFAFFRHFALADSVTHYSSDQLDVPMTITDFERARERLSGDHK